MKEIEFPVANPVVLRNLAIHRSNVRKINGKGYLYYPAANGGPRPAVVLLQGLGGLIHEREHRYGQFLASKGYVTLVVSTFEPRRAAVKSHGQRALRVTKAMMLADAFGALNYLCGLDRVDSSRVHVVGFSYGGMVSVLCAYEQIAALYAPGGPRFAGHCAYYGSSVPRMAEPLTTAAPVLMMLGAKDRNVCTVRSEKIADDLARGGSDVQFHLFEGAYHQWDSKDRAPRFVRHSLINCRMRIDDEYHMRDERDGRIINNRLSRAMALARSVDFDGYHILRDEATIERSDDALLGFLAKTGTFKSGAQERGRDRQSTGALQLAAAE